MKRKKDAHWKRKRVIAITETQVHRAFHELALTECKRWVRRRGGNVPIRAHD
ncbi:MAG: hypothetical protein G01um101417_150 [Parcubacteria group bacterium Gr01-1014_17]|nr:MAG: hypothetical protein G01um101417_150 [Parcubacteria group bacterium Gr01-1014_17]